MTEKEPLPGVLYVVATPIGNLDDITLRALKILGGADWVAAEDTRRTRILMARHKLRARLISLSAESESRKTPALIDGLETGESGAVVSDAGTPGASDPGGKLVAAAAGRGIRVVPVPGASAIAAAFSASGLSDARFVFEGFLPRTGAKRERRLESLAREERHIIFFESAKRINATLAELYGKLGDRRAIIFRELTKIHEEIIRTQLCEIAEKRLILKEIGEYTVVVEGKPGVAVSDEAAAGAARAVRALARTELSPGDIAKLVIELYGGAKNQIYNAVLRAREEKKNSESG